MAASEKIWINDSLPQCSAEDLNGFKNEINILITSSSQVLNTADNTQTTKAVSAYASAGDAYSDTGISNAYILAPIGSRLSPGLYLDEMRVRFVPLFTNTGACTVIVDGISVVDIKDEFDQNLESGAILNGISTEISYSQSKGFFRLIKGNPAEILRNALNFVIDEAVGTLEGGADGLTFDTIGNAINGMPFGIPTTITILLDYTMKPGEFGILNTKYCSLVGASQATKLTFLTTSDGFIGVSNNGILTVANLTVEYTQPTVPILNVDEPFYCSNATIVFGTTTFSPSAGGVIFSQTNAAQVTSIVKPNGNVNVQFFGTQFLDSPSSTNVTQTINVESPFTGDPPNVFAQYTATTVAAEGVRWTQTPSQINEIIIRDALIVDGAFLAVTDAVIGGQFQVNGAYRSAVTTLTIASAAVTKVGSYHLLTGEGGVADTLSTITGGVVGDIIDLAPSDDAVDITIDNAGNIRPRSSPIVMTSIDDMRSFRLNAGGNWAER